MTWKQYTLAFRLLSPLHIGYRKVSNLQQTRGYVPGKVLWAALTARLTRETIPGAKGKDYIEVGQNVNDHFRFTYLYPALDPTGPACYPWDDDFAYRFLSSYASTALNYDHQSAAEGSLHEVEFIRPRARPLNGEEPPQVYLVGCLYVQEVANTDETLQGWQAALRHIQLGGERGYGWGRVQLYADIPKPCQAGLEKPQIPYLPGKRLLAHALAVDENSQKTVTNVAGPIEPLVGWQRDNRPDSKSAWHIPEATICYAPGAKVTATEAITFAIGPDGILYPT